MSLKVGDRIISKWDGKKRHGVVASESIGWNPPIYRIQFNDGERIWLSRSSFEVIWCIS